MGDHPIDRAKQWPHHHHHRCSFRWWWWPRWHRWHVFSGIRPVWRQKLEWTHVCETGCQCRSEGEWYSQCAPPAGSHRCGGTIMFDEQVQEGPLVGGVARTVSPNLLMACVAMMFVMGASLVAFKLRRRRQQPSCDGKGIPQLLSSHEEDVEGLQ